MAFVSQTWTLTKKNILIVFFRHWLSTGVRAFLAPIIFMFFISYAKNFFVPPSDFGIGSPTDLLSFSDALAQRAGGRNTLPFVTNGLGGDVLTIINDLSSTVTSQGLTAVTLATDDDLLETCKSSIRGTSPCFAAVSFHSTATTGSVWNYTIRADGSFGERIYVNAKDGDAQIYVLPLQHAVDSAIAATNGTTIPNPTQYPYTSQTSEQRAKNITRLYMGSLISILAVAYLIGIIGVTYQLTGQMASERELGMSQLIEAMMPNARRWEPQLIRLLSTHLSFDIIYLPSWIIMGAIVARNNYPKSSTGIMVGYFIVSGLALSSWSIAFASFFRKAQLSGITVTIVSIILGIIVQVQTPTSTGAIAVLSLLFPPMNFVLFIIYMAYWQQKDLPAMLSESCPSAPWRLPGYAFFIFSIIQFLVYPIIGAIVERTLYGTASKARNMKYSGESSSETVRIEGLSKRYEPTWAAKNIWRWFGKKISETVVAVDDLDMVIRKGELSVLLGANGSGKSTTMDMLAGLQAPTNGSIHIDGTGGLGLCPQKNVIWDELTCREHVKIFNQLKAEGSKDSKDQIREMLIACDLEQKLDARSETLSGGQKRKLQLAMMLTGGSSLCLLDEVSSGLDPLSRRKIWDILLAERGRRSMLFTTHFLDEADLLSDQITILSKGKLVASGSAVALKHSHGGGYRAKIYNSESFEEPSNWDQLSKRIHSDHVTYNLPDSAAAAAFVAQLESLGVDEYRVSGPSVEDVFLKLAAEAQDTTNVDGAPLKNVTSIASGEKGLELSHGRKISLLAQTWVLFRKRVTILRRNYLPYCAAVLIPIIAAGLVTLFLKGFTALGCSPTSAISNEEIDSLSSYALSLDIPAGPPSGIPTALLNLLYPQANDTAFNPVATLADLNAYIAANYSSVSPGGFFVNTTAAPTFAWRGDYGMQYAILVQNLLDNSILKTLPILTAYQPFNVPFAPSAGKTLQFVLYFGLAMSAYPGFFALYPTMERKNKVRALHWSNGVRAFPLWLAYTLFDFIFVLIISAVAVIIFTSASSQLYYSSWLFLVFFLYGLAALLLSYVVSLFVTSQLAAFAFSAGYLCATFLIYFIAFICVQTYAAPVNIPSYETIAGFTIGVVTPSGMLLRALLLTFNEFSLLCDGQEIRSYPGGILVYGGPILYSIVQSIVLLGILVWYDSGWRPSFLIRNTAKPKEIEETEEVDDEVVMEKHRVEKSEDELRVLHVTKTFGDNTAVDDITFGVPRGEIFALLGPNGAGKSTTISVIRGDLRPTHGEGDVLVQDISIVKHRASARIYEGVCPQFDAMDSMTAVEHLRFYARARGVGNIEHNVEQVIEAVGLTPYRNRMAAKLSGGNKRKLSLGIALIGNPSVLLVDEGSSGMDAAAKRVMWRTLSAVSAGRSLVLTTHAMEEADALADRVGIMAKRMLALGTSDTLRRKHGDAYYVHLVHKDAPHTTGAEMDAIKSWIKQNFPAASVEDRSFHGQIRFSVPNRTASPASSDDGSSTGGAGGAKKEAITTVVPADGSSSGRSGISTLFGKLEQSKQPLGLEFYAVSQATLDQVFLSIVGQHNIEEENYQREHVQKVTAWDKIKRGLRTMVHNA